jgi:uncharacterized membrane protein (UPF0127 family)
VRLLHAETGAVVASQVVRAETVGARLKGLLGRDGLSEGDALVIEPCASIHTFFMRFTIDAVFLSREGRVLRALHSMKPWRASRIYPRAAMVVELPAGTLAKSGTSEGDLLRFQV